MATITGPLLVGSELIEDRDGYVVRENYLVRGVSGTDRERIFAALNDAGIPDYGDGHPYNTTSSGTDGDIFVSAKVARPVSDASPDDFLVTVTFSRPEGPVDTTSAGGALPPARITIGSATVPMETNVDSSGTQLTVTHDGATQGGVVTIEKPQKVITFDRTETADPSSKIDTYNGTVNNLAWKGHAPRTLLITRFDGRQDTQTGNWEVSLSMQYNPSTWDATYTFIDPETGRPPAGLTAGVGIKTSQVYTATDFTVLDLYGDGT